MTAPPTNAAPPLVQNVLDRLEGVVARPTGRAWRASCPVEHTAEHLNDQLQITLARDGRVLLDCPAGCRVDDVLDSIGLKKPDLFPEQPETLDQPDQPSHEGENTEEILPKAIRAIDAPPPRPIEWIVNDLFTAGEIGLLVGDGGSFKSTAAISMAAALASGNPVWNRHAAPQRPVLIISAEDSMDVVMMRLNAFIVGHGYDRTTVLSNIHLFTTTDVSLGSRSWQQHILAEAARIQPGMIVFDPFAELITGDENSNSEVRPTVKYLRHLGRESHAAVLVVHHAGKAGQDKRTLDRIRGASALPSAARSILFFDFQPNGAGVAVEHLKMSRSPRLDRFILARHIEHDQLNRALWFEATLKSTEVRVALERRAETFVLAQVTASPRSLTTGKLRELAAKERISTVELGAALNELQKQRKITYDPGSRGAKYWYVPGSKDEGLNLPLDG